MSVTQGTSSQTTQQNGTRHVNPGMAVNPQNGGTGRPDMMQLQPAKVRVMCELV